VTDPRALDQDILALARSMHVSAILALSGASFPSLALGAIVNA
jgi:hypothetical protein